jgi:hypothetical protein
MLNLSRIIKPWKEADALSAHINLYGFWTETAFLTKSGDLGMVLSVTGVDYESLDNDEQQYAVKRLESALKSFGEGFHVYQYLFKTNRPEIPFARYDDELIDAAIDQRRQYFESKRDRLYEVELFYVIVLEGARSKTGILSALARIPRDPQGAIRELKAQFTNDNMKVLLRKQIDTDMVRLEQCVQNFTRHLADLMPIEVQGHPSISSRSTTTTSSPTSRPMRRRSSACTRCGTASRTSSTTTCAMGRTSSRRSWTTDTSSWARKRWTSRERTNVMADTLTATADPKLTDHTPQPKGVLQKNLKMFLYLGAVVLLILATVISSRKKAPTDAEKAKATGPQPYVQDNTATNVDPQSNFYDREAQPIMYGPPRDCKD